MSFLKVFVGFVWNTITDWSLMAIALIVISFFIGLTSFWKASTQIYFQSPVREFRPKVAKIWAKICSHKHCQQRPEVWPFYRTLMRVWIAIEWKLEKSPLRRRSCRRRKSAVGRQTCGGMISWLILVKIWRVPKNQAWQRQLIVFGAPSSSRTPIGLEKTWWTIDFLLK